MTRDKAAFVHGVRAGILSACRAFALLGIPVDEEGIAKEVLRMPEFVIDHIWDKISRELDKEYPCQNPDTPSSWEGRSDSSPMDLTQNAGVSTGSKGNTFAQVSESKPLNDQPKQS